MPGLQNRVILSTFSEMHHYSVNLLAYLFTWNLLVCLCGSLSLGFRKTETLSVLFSLSRLGSPDRIPSCPHRVCSVCVCVYESHSRQYQVARFVAGKKEQGIVGTHRGFPGGSAVKNPPQCRSHRRRGFNPWVRKIPWGRTWQPSPVFLPGEFCGQRSLEGYGP